MNKIRFYAALIAVCASLSAFTACGGNTVPAETTVGAATTEPAVTEPIDGKIDFGGLRFALDGGAKYENGIITGERNADSNTALCEDIGTSEGCLDIKVKLTASTSGGISFKYKNDDRRIFIGFDRRSNTVRINNYTKDGASLVKSLYCPMDNGEEITIRIAFRNSLIILYKRYFRNGDPACRNDSLLIRGQGADA